MDELCVSLLTARVIEAFVLAVLYIFVSYWEKSGLIVCAHWHVFNDWLYFTTDLCVHDFHIYMKKLLLLSSGTAVIYVIAVPSPTVEPTEVPCPEFQIPLCHDDQHVQSTTNTHGCTEFVCGESRNLIFMFQV
jgi:hypothetical protein